MNTQEMLAQQVDAKAEDIREFARQIKSGEYGNRWTVARVPFEDWTIEPYEVQP